MLVKKEHQQLIILWERHPCFASGFRLRFPSYAPTRDAEAGKGTKAEEKSSQLIPLSAGNP